MSLNLNDVKNKQGVLVVAKRRGDRVRYRNTLTAHLGPWVRLPEMHPDSLYGQAKVRLLAILES